MGMNEYRYSAGEIKQKETLCDRQHELRPPEPENRGHRRGHGADMGFMILDLAKSLPKLSSAGG